MATATHLSSKTVLAPGRVGIVYSEPGMCGHGPGAWIEFALKDMFHLGSGCVNSHSLSDTISDILSL